MYLAQTGDIGPIIKALNEAGVTGLLLVALILFLCGFVLAFLLVRNKGKKTDSDATVMKALVDQSGMLVSNITKLTDNQLEMQTGARKRDQQIDLTIKATEEQNKLLTAGNQLAQRMLIAVQDNTKDTHDVLDATVEHLDGKVNLAEANIMAKIDTQTQRIVNNASESHSNLKQTIIERTKSIEDLFTRLSNENEDLTDKVQLRDDTIISLQSQLTAAQTELAALKAPATPVATEPAK